MTEDILFDNLYIGHSVEDAQKLAEQTFEVKKKIEEDVKKVEEKAEAEEAGDFQTIFKDDPVGFVREKVLEFVEIAKIDFVFAAKAMPEVAAGLGLVALFFVGALFSLLFGSSSKPAPSAVSFDFSPCQYRGSNAHHASFTSHTRRTMPPQPTVNQKLIPLPSQRLGRTRSLILLSRSESKSSLLPIVILTVRCIWDSVHTFTI